MAGLSVGVLMKDSQVLIPKVTVFSETRNSSHNLALFRKVTFSGSFGIFFNPSLNLLLRKPLFLAPLNSRVLSKQHSVF